MKSQQSKNLSYFILLAYLIVFTSAFTYSNFELTDSNQGVNSDYIFSFKPDLTLTYVETVITFPIQYSVSSFTGVLDCYFSSTGVRREYMQKNCWVQPDSTANTLYLLGSVVVPLQYLNSTNINYVLLRNVKNPTTNTSSYFQVCLRKNGVKLQCMKYFSKSVFSTPSLTKNLGVSITPTPSPAYIGRGTTYDFSLTVSTPTLSYLNQNLIIRVKFDSDFSSDGSLCWIGSYNQFGFKNQYVPITTNILPATFSHIDCGPISNLQDFLGPNNQLLIKIDNLFNPLSFNTYTNTKVQVIRQLYMQPIQTTLFPNSSIQIIPEQIQVTIKQQNYMKKSTNVYYFMLNHFTDLNSSSSITINFLTGVWSLYDCFAMFGFTSPTTAQCTIIGNKVKLSNFGIASHKIQQVFGINLTSYDVAGTYSIRVETQLFNQTLGSWNGNVFLNQTIGTFNMLSVSAVASPTKLPVGKTGPLQMNFFLNYQLPPSGDVPNGTLQITIYPQIPQPDPIRNGIVKCYWKGTLQAADCTYDNSSPNKTIITLLSPPFDAYQYSQIPVIITTQGGLNTSELGLTIDPLVQRYRFQCEFHLYNSSQIPSQVFYTTWIADAIYLTTTTITATTYECQQYTHLQINLTTPLLDSSLPKQFRILVKFLNADGSGWARSVGYQIDQIYQRYPCLLIGLVGSNIHCDLYTYYQRLTPYSNLHINYNFNGPFIMIYGFDQNIATGLPVRIQIPKIKIGSLIGTDAVIGLSILEQTPGEKQPYVQLYYQDVVVFRTLPPINIPYTNVPSSQPSPILIQTFNQYHILWNPILPASVKYIMYEMTPEYLPSLVNKDAACNTNPCVGLGLPANWIVETPAAVANPHTMDTLAGYIRSMDYLPLSDSYIPIRMVTYNGNGKTVNKYEMDIHYMAIPIPSSSFDFLQTNVYGGLQQWYSVSFANTNSTLSSYPFLRFILANGLSFSDPPQCNSSTILPYNQSGIICIREDPQTMRVQNIKSLAPLGTYNIWMRMQTTLPAYNTSISPQIQIQINHNNSVDSSIVAVKHNLSLTQNPVFPLLSAPKEFQIHNPQIINEDIQIGYIGPLYMQYVSQISGVFDITVTFNPHFYNGGYWRTPTQNNLDPVVCFLNQIRYDCSPNNAAKVLSIKTLQNSVVAGLNQLRFDTQYIDPFNGIKFPDVPGMYSIQITLANSTSSASVTIYSQIHPPKFLHMQAGSIVKDINTQSVYKINFTLPAWHPPPTSYFDAVNRSRITIQFPTLVGSQPAFTSNLGLYQGTFQERVGCYFKTGGNYITFAPNYTLQCRLIPSGKLGDPVKVQIINHANFTSAQNSLSVYIFKVINPNYSLSSIPITVRIDQIQVVTGFIYPMYKQTYRLFLDPRPQNVVPTTYPSVDASNVQFFQSLKDVGDYGSIFMTAQTVTGATLTQPFHMLIMLPPYLNPQDNQIAPAFTQCPPSSFEECVSVPEINYLMIKGIFNVSQFKAVIKNFPISISQSDSFFYSNIIQFGRFTGIIQYKITAANRWKQIQGTLVLNYCQATGLQSKLVKNKDHFELVISFTNKNFIPQTGSIQIGFPSSVTNVMPHCRSSTQLGSKLFTRSGNSGQIGCMVQNTNKWVITGFADVPPSSNIIIRGQVDLPSAQGTIGMGQIITYADTNLVDIYTNGSRIDYLRRDFNLILLDTFAMNANEDIFMTQRDVIRTGFVGQFRILLKSVLSIANTDSITLRMGMNDIRGTPGGFTLSSRPLVCEFIRIDTNQQIGCKVTSSNTDISILNHQCITYVLQPTQALLASVTYQIRLTTQSYSEPALLEGIPYPTSPGRYKIQTMTTISGVSKTQHRYIQIYGPAFTQLKITQYNYLAGQYNLIWVQFIPTVTISTSHQIVLEFPTLSSNGTRMFDDNLGLNSYKDGDTVPVDIFDSAPLTNIYMTCKIFFGDRTRGVPVRLVCGFLASNLITPSYLRFAFGFMNPAPFTVATVPSQISLPLIVYSYDPYYFEKTNFNLVNTAVFVYNGPNILAPNGYFATTSNQLQFPNDNLMFGNAHTFPLLVGDAYVVRFNFPIRVNDKKGLCNQAAVAGTLYGDAYYHQRLRIIVCKVTSATVPAQVSPLSATMMFSGFYTPWYRLADSQRIVSAIASYQSTSTSQVINYFDLFPILPPRWKFDTISSLALQGHLKHYTACQSDDYTLRVRLQSLGSANLDLQYCKMISINLPLTTVIDYYTLNTDCVEHPDSQIQIVRCNIDLSARAIFVQIVPGIYSNGLMIAVKTKDHALRNPCVFWNAFSITKFTVLFYSWENITYADSRSPDYAYMIMDSRNIDPAFTLPHTTQTPGGLLSYYYTFDWIHTPHERYYNEFPQYKLGQYSPFTLQIWVNTTIAAAPAGQYHTIALQYGNNYITRNSQWALDLNYDKPVCYFDNNRVQRCYLDIVNKIIYMQFNFAVIASKPLHVYFSILDPRQPDKNGFMYNGTSDIDKVFVSLTDYLGNKLVFETQPYTAKQTHVGGTGAPLPQRGIKFATIDWATSMTGRLNVVDMQLNVNRSDITGLQFIIPQVNQVNQVLFTGNTRSAFFNINDGGQYPCGNNYPGVAGTGKPKCYIYNGKNTHMGFPTVITMVDFQYSGSIIKARLIFYNPDVDMVWFSIKVKAFAGTPDPKTLFGHQYVGYWYFFNFFRTVPGTYLYTPVANTLATTSYLRPDKGNWRQKTTWTLANPTSGGNTMVALGAGLGGYAIVQVLLNSYTSSYIDDQFCEADFTIGSSASDDMLILKSKQSNYTKAFFIKKWTTSPWNIQYFKCKHYGNGLKSYQYPSQIVMQQDQHSYTANIYYLATTGGSLIKYFQVISNRVLLQFDLSTMFTTLTSISQQFIWDYDVDYELNIDLTFYSFTSWNAVSNCYITGGFKNTKGGIPNCVIRSTTQFTIRNFQQILTRTNGNYIIKIQLDVSQLQTSPNSLGASFTLYANQDTNLWNNNREFIYSTTTSNTYSRSLTVKTGLTSGAGYCGVSNSYNNIDYSIYIGSNNLNVDVLQFGRSLSTSSLDLKLSIIPLTLIDLQMSGSYDNVYPYLRFYVQGFDFTCTGISKMQLKYFNSANNSETFNALGWAGTTCGANFFEIQFYSSQNIESSIWNGLLLFNTNQRIQVTAEFSIAVVTQIPYLRDWIGIRAFINNLQYYSYTSCCCSCCCNPCSDTRYDCQTSLEANSYQGHGAVKLADNMVLSALSLNFDIPTQFIFTITQIYPTIGSVSVDKILLLQFNTASHPINYINTTASGNYPIQCKCITSWAANFDPSTMVSPPCQLRIPAAPFINFAITIDIDVAPNQNLQCYIPGWQPTTALPYTATAKLINQGSSFAPFVTNNAVYGGFYWIAGLNSVSFTSSATQSLIVADNPDAYSVPQYVNLPYTSAYSLTLTLSTSTILNPIVYVDFQKSGFIPDQSFCASASTFSYCRVYNKYRNIIVAKFITPTSTSTVQFTKGSTNLQYPKHKQPGIDYSVLAYMRSDTSNLYTFSGSLLRNNATLLTTDVPFYCEPQQTTGSNFQTFQTNIIISFNMGGHKLYSFPIQGAQINIFDNMGLLTVQRGCTATSVDNPTFVLDCYVKGGMIIVKNPSYDDVLPLSVSGLIQVVIGITNPSAPVLWTLISYEYYFGSTNYGKQIQSYVTYTPTLRTGTKQQRFQIRTLPFVTKVYSTVHSPFRIAFKISNSPPSLPDIIDYDASQKMILQGFDGIPTYTNYECLFKEYTLEPTEAPQSPLANSYRNWKQHTQYIPLYAYCNIVGTTLQIQAPRIKSLSINNYYELIIMPTGSTLPQTGFADVLDTQFRLITYPNSCQYIGQWLYYEGSLFALNSMYLVTTRPLVSTALQLHFQILFTGSVIYPNHYFEIHFQDINYLNIKSPYNQVGMKVPCTLSNQFVTAGRKNGPHCVVNYVHQEHQDLVLRVVQIGNLAPSNAYKISLDDFLLPGLSTLLQQSNPFSVCLRYHNQPSNIHYQKCFEQLFVIDGTINITPVINNVGTFHLPTPNNYAAAVTGKLQFNYSMSSTSLVDEKAVARVLGGYSATSANPLSFSSYGLLWYNPMINLYVLTQPPSSPGTPTNISILGLTNPQPYQKQQYSLINTIEMTYYDVYHPNNYYLYNQPPYSYFVLYPSNVRFTTTYLSDIRTTIPTDSQSIVRMLITITDLVAQLTTKLNDKFQIAFNTADVSQVQQCWVQTVNVPVPYRMDAACQTTTDGRVLLYNFYNANVYINLVLFVRLRHTANTIRAVSKLYSDNNQIQYNDTYSFTLNKISLTTANHQLLQFTQNYYTGYYYQQAITPLTISSTCKYMHFSLNLPQNLLNGVTIITIALPPTIILSNTAEIRQRCQWMVVDRYNRQFYTGVYSYCQYSGGMIRIRAPYGGLLANNGAIPFAYLLRIRQFDVINTRYFMPTTAKPEQLLFGFNDTNIFKYDTMIFHPYQHFNSLSPQLYTLNINQLSTYHIQFIPTVTVAPGYQAVLQLSIDTRYLVKDLGMPSLFSTYGANYNNESRINNLNYNIKYDILNNKWINGAPYSCYTSTLSKANQTTVHTGTGNNNKRTRITHLLETAYVGGTKYIWKVPLLLNPSILNLPFRMNLTLWTYQTTGIGLGQKQLFYEIINHKFTQPNNPTTFSYTMPNNNAIQATNANISINFNLVGDAPALGHYVQLKLNNQLVGIIGLNNLQQYTEGDATYTFFFFPRINLLMAHKKITDFSTRMDLGALKITNQYADYYGYDWVKVHSAASSTTLRKAGPVTKLLTNCAINLTPLISITQGIGNIKDSQYLLTIIFTNTGCWIPRNSTMIISYSGAIVQSLTNSRCYISFREYTCIHSNGRIQITFYDQIPVGTPIIIRIYLRNIATGSTVLTGFIYGIPGASFTKVFDIPNFGTIACPTNNLIDAPLFQHIQTNYIYQLTQMDIRGTIIPNNPVTFVDMTHPFTSSLASNQRMIMRPNATSPYLFNYFADTHYFQHFQRVISNSQAIYTIPPNGLITYNMVPNTQYSFILQSTYDTSGLLNNFTVGPVGSYYLFKYVSDNQIACKQVYPISVADHLTIINPFTQISQQTAIGVKFAVANLSIIPGNRITIQLDTYNLRYDMFRKTSQYSIQCVQRVKGILTWQKYLVCEVTQQPTILNPNQALIVTIYPKLTVAAGTVIQVWLSPIFNPDIVMVSGATVRVDKNCNGQKRCVIYEARGYYRTTTGMNMSTGLLGTFTPTPTQVLMKDASHTFNIQPDTYTAMFFRYPQNYNTVMPLQCIQSGGNTCLIFPNQRRVLTLLSNITTSAITLEGMTNGIYLQPLSQFVDVLALTPTTSNLYKIPHKNLTTRRQIPATAAPTWMTITPTQTPNIFLRNYMNTATFQIYGLYSTTFVNCFYINAPVEIVTWDKTYCNATFESLNHDPYPTRLFCSYINQSTLQIIIPDGVYQIYVPNITQEFIMTVHAKFFIQNFAPGDGILYVTPPVISGTFNAYGSYSVLNHNYPFYITQASTPITISQHRVPIVGSADFNTENFVQRQANINQLTTFQLLIDPNTTQTIGRIQLVIPQQFGYPPVGVHDACKMITTDITNIYNCYEIRRNNKTILSLEMVNPYDNGPRIVKIASLSNSSWFTAPSMPGSWYNMTVLIYSLNGTLLQAQTTKNCSQIGGIDLDMPDIIITNGRDQKMNQIIDVSFVVGSQSIRRGYSDGLRVGQFYTQIRIIFENLKAYDRALGLNLLDGELTGCVTRNILFNRQIACALNIGLHINDEPYISVTGYEPIMPYTNVTISFANIFNLPAAQFNTISVAVMLKRAGQNKTAFLYNPTKRVAMVTSGLSTTLPSQVSILYNSPRVINSPTILNFIITPSVTVDSYFVLKFPLNAFNAEYQLFPTRCSLASRVDIFYRSNVVRIYPLTPHLNGTMMSYVITGFPSPKYAMGPIPWNVTVEAYSNLKQVNSQIYTIPNFEMATCRLSFGIISATSPYTHQTQVAYVFEFLIPASNAKTQNLLTIGVKFPAVYGDIRTSNMTCKMNTNATCQFTRANYIQISGTRQTGQLTHRMTLQHVINPETLTNIFQISSYLGENVQNVICSGQAQINLLSMTVKTCNLQVTPDQSTKRQQAIYHFGFTCPDVIKNNSVAYIKLPNNYGFNNVNSLKCWADSRSNLLTDRCTLQFINGSFYLVVTNIIINKNQKGIGINVIINNPAVAGPYLFTANITVSNYTYLLTTTDNITIYDGLPTTIQSIQLINQPKQSGIDAYYFIRVPTSSINSTFSIGFPPEFQLPSQITIQKFQSNSSTWASSLQYGDILNLQGTPLNSQVIVQDGFNQQMNIFETNTVTASQGSWTYFMIHPIRNPAYQTQQNFTIDSYYSFGNDQNILTGTADLALNYTLNPPCGDIIHVGINVTDNDVLFFTDYNLTYRLSKPHQTNQTTIYIVPPIPDFNYGLISLNFCIVINSSSLSPYTYCNVCQIMKNTFEFPIIQNGLRIPADSNFTIRIMNLYNPPNATDCTLFPHHQLSYFSISFLKNDLTVTHTSIAPTNLNSPCQQFRNLREDIIPIFPNIIYAGMVHPFKIKLSQPTKMLKVILNSSDPFVSFSPNILYFPSYDVTELSGNIIVSSIANNNSKAYINVTHLQSGSFDFYRPNLPYPVQVVAGHKQYVTVDRAKAQSVGYDIDVPINITLPSSVDMYLQITASPNDPNLILNSTQIILPAFSSSSKLTFRYNGNKIPPTINISLNLKSSYPLFYELKPPTVYLYFETSPNHNTLPPVMTAKVIYNYQNNSQFIGRTVYHYNNTGFLYYDKLLPLITIHKDDFIGSTSADIAVYTRLQCTVAYVVYQYGDHLTYKPRTPQEIRSNPKSTHLLSKKNSSLIVNPFTYLNLTSLEQQTQYFIYMMAYSTLGNSVNITTHVFRTKVLSNAVQFKLITLDYVQTDQVKIVKALADILKIDPYRIKVISSQKRLQDTFINPIYKNEPLYEHKIVISPSTTKDVLPAEQLVLERLMKSQFGIGRLKQLIPNWIGRFNLADLKLLNRIKPDLRNAPIATKISYYNATFKVSYWNKARIHAIILVFPNKTLDTLNYTQITVKGYITTDPITPKQVTKGVDEFNTLVTDYYTALSNDDTGQATIFFKNLQPGAKYIMYTTATNPETFEPTIYADNVTKTEFYTLWNPNLNNKDKLILDELKVLKPEMYQAIKQFYDNEQKKKKKANAKTKTISK